jgi:hypothetical protein
MPRKRIYKDNAARQLAYRERFLNCTRSLYKGTPIWGAQGVSDWKLRSLGQLQKLAAFVGHDWAEYERQIEEGATFRKIRQKLRALAIIKIRQSTSKQEKEALGIE